MKVNQIMNRPVNLTDPTTTIAAAAGKRRDEDVGCLPGQREARAGKGVNTMRDFGTESLHSHRHRAARTAVPITAEADYALAYTADLFNRLTGYPALERLKQARTREALAEAEYATAYANDTFERLRGVPEREAPGHDFRFVHDRHRSHGERTWGALSEAEYAVAYVNDTFERLRGFPAQESLCRTVRSAHADHLQATPLPRVREARARRKEPVAGLPTTAMNLLSCSRSTSATTKRICAGTALPSRRVARPLSAAEGSGRSGAQAQTPA